MIQMKTKQNFELKVVERDERKLTKLHLAVGLLRYCRGLQRALSQKKLRSLRSNYWKRTNVELNVKPWMKTLCRRKKIEWKKNHLSLFLGAKQKCNTYFVLRLFYKKNESFVRIIKC